MPPLISENPAAAFRALRAQGATLPNNPVAARMAAQRMTREAMTPGSLSEMAYRLGPSEGRKSLSAGGIRMLDKKMLADSSPKAQKAIEEMHKRRQGGTHRTDVAYAWPIQRDPFEAWREKNYWWFQEGDRDKELKKLRDWCRLIYSTHSLMPSLIDIYSRFPLQDIEFRHKDEKLSQYYEDLLMNQLLYEEFLYDMSREYWTVGEVFPLGSWHDGIGAWDGDEIINPDDVVVTKNRALRSHNFHLKVPKEIKELIEKQEPRAEYMMLMELYPDVVNWARQDKEIPVSDILMKQLKFKTDSWSEHGNPIMMRAFRTLMHEESLNAAQDAVADRLYSPVILAQLGLDNVDEEGPWIPDPTELDSLRDDLYIAFLSDFRLIVYHHGLNMESVFGKEDMPDLDKDFDRIDRKLMQIFGIGEELLTGGKSGVPYASGALNRELLTNMLVTHQTYVKRFLKERMEVVAERQEHYEYEEHGGFRRPVMETALMIDEETGEEYVEERPKLAVPEVHFKAMNLRDEQTEREFLQMMKDSGFPISDQALAVNIPFDFDEELERSKDEKIDKVIAEVEFKEELFNRIYHQDYICPADLVQDYKMWCEKMGLEVPAYVSSQSNLPVPDISGDTPTPNVSPTEEQFAEQERVNKSDLKRGETPEQQALKDVMKQVAPFGAPQRPEVSDDQRATMPKPAATFKQTHKVREARVTPEEYERGIRVTYGDSLDMRSPEHTRARRKMLLGEGGMEHKVFARREEKRLLKPTQRHASLSDEDLFLSSMEVGEWDESQRNGDES